MTARLARLAPLLLVAIAAAIPAQDPPPKPSAEFFHSRRQLVMKGVLEQMKRKEDERYPVIFLRGAGGAGSMDTFYQDHDFYYLSGISEPGLAMLLFPESGREVLLVPPFNRFTATWEGTRLAPGEETAKATGFTEVGNVRGLQRDLEGNLTDEKGRQTVVWTFLQPQPNKTSTPGSASGAATGISRDFLDGRPSRERQLATNLEERYGVEVEDVTEIIGGLRAVKEPDEIACIRAASEIAAAGIAEAMRSTSPGTWEFQIAAAARYVFTRLGAGPDAYAAIVGAGPNGCILHYSALSKQALSGELVVMDYAPTVHGYASDVTRTFPVNGKFTAAQRKLVEDVHAIQAELIGMIKPGTQISQLGTRCRQLLKERGYGSAHGPCHHVGLAVHDKQGDVLQPGMLLTVEPGAYLKDEGMGCRIEDVVLVTETGHEVLSAAVPSTPDEIERLMQQPGLQDRAIGKR